MVASNQRVDPRWLGEIYKRGGNRAEGAKNVLSTVRHNLAEYDRTDGKEGFSAEQVSIKGLGLMFGVIDPYDEATSLRENMAMYSASTERVRPETMLTESNAGVATNAFQIITGELINSEVIAGYEDDANFIGDRLVKVMSNQRLRDQRITGITSLAGPNAVSEGHPYEESGFTEKYVTTKEAKKGRLLSINEELILFDQTGEILNRARNLGFYTRQERERVIVRGVMDADAGTDPVYRPSGTGTALYSVTGELFNYIGSGNTTSTDFNTAVPLVDYTDLNEIRQYRATEIKDDRIDGTTRAIAGMNGPDAILLVPEALLSTAHYITTQQFTRTNPASNGPAQQNANPVLLPLDSGNVLSSPIVDEDSAVDYYYGQFKKQFVWTEIYPIQTFTQGATSEAAFERDVVFRLKVRYYGGITATDTKWVTQIDGV